MSSSRPANIHPLWLRCCHWVNAIAIAGMLFSGWRIYNASPLFDFTFPASLTLGGWLVAFPDAAMHAWAILPPDIKSILPPNIMQIISYVLIGASVLSQYVRQTKLTPPEDPQ